MAKKSDETMPMTFEHAKAMAAADLAAVAELFVNASEAVSAGDLGQLEITCDKMTNWREMLMIRHFARMEELRETGTPPKKAARA